MGEEKLLGRFSREAAATVRNRFELRSSLNALEAAYDEATKNQKSQS
jgi:hypothetical protein